MTIYDGSIYAALGEYSCDLRRTVTLNTEFEDFFYDFRAFLVYNPFLFVLGSFL